MSDAPDVFDSVRDLIAMARGPLPPGSRLLGFGFATVDMDRAIRDAGLTGQDPSWAEAEEPLLGARAVVIKLAVASVVVLEPSTEGKLAGWLARNGEGWAVRYVRADPQRVTSAPRAPTALGADGWLEPKADSRSQFVILVG